MVITAMEPVLLRLPFPQPVRVAYGRYDDRLLLLVRATAEDGRVGWGECAALEDRRYFWEDVRASLRAVDGPLRRVALGEEPSTARAQVVALDDDASGPMARAAVEMALLDLELRGADRSLASSLGVATSATVRSQVAVGMPDVDALGIDAAAGRLAVSVAGLVDSGVRAIKLKIAPGWNFHPIQRIRASYGADVLGVIADANGSFSPSDATLLARISDLDVMLEQPLPADDLEGHRALRRSGVGNVCLDESVATATDVDRVLRHEAADVLCLKPGRLGGIDATRAVIRRCQELGVRARIGGMYSAALGGAVERALAVGLEQSDLAPNGARFRDGIDLAAVDRPDEHGRLPVWSAPGVGPEPAPDVIEKFAVSTLDVGAVLDS